MATIAGADRLTQLKAFDDTKAGVKGLVDADVTSVPPIFHHPPDPHDAATSTAATIPVIDLAAVSATTTTNDTAHHHHHHHQQELVKQVKAAAETVGFFQVINHGVPADLLARMLASVRAFNEEPVEARRPYYTRDPTRRVRYHSNFDLFCSPAANWRDTVFIDSAAAAPDEMPPAFRDVVPEYTRHVRGLGARLLALLSEALGLRDAGYLQLQRDAAGSLDAPELGCHYYPPCPEPRLTLGTTRHSDSPTPASSRCCCRTAPSAACRRSSVVGGWTCRRCPARSWSTSATSSSSCPTTGSRAWSTGWWPCLAPLPRGSRRRASSGPPAPPRPPWRTALCLSSSNRRRRRGTGGSPPLSSSDTIGRRVSTDDLRSTISGCCLELLIPACSLPWDFSFQTNARTVIPEKDLGDGDSNSSYETTKSPKGSDKF